MSSPRFAPRNFAWSRIDHSHSRFVRKPYCDGNASLFSVVSIWNTLTCSLTTRPIRQADECSCDECRSMNDRECTMVWLLWWCRNDLYDASPIAVDFQPPSIATRLTLTYTSRSDSAARLEISTSSFSSVMPRCERFALSSASKL